MVNKESGLLMARTQAMMKAVRYDPYKFLRAIRCCRENEQYQYGFMAAAFADEVKCTSDICERAISVLSANQLSGDNSQFVLEIEQAIKKIQESPEGQSGFFLNVQEQINYHEAILKEILSYVNYDRYRLVRKLEECNMADQLHKMAEECHPPIEILSFGTQKESEVYKSAIVERLCCNAHDDITAIKQGADKGLGIRSSLFFALIESVNYNTAVKSQ